VSNHGNRRKGRGHGALCVCDTTPRGSGRARRLRKGRVREGRDKWAAHETHNTELRYCGGGGGVSSHLGGT